MFNVSNYIIYNIFKSHSENSKSVEFKIFKFIEVQNKIIEVQEKLQGRLYIPIFSGDVIFNLLKVVLV